MIEYTNGTKWYNYNNGRLHREDGPAVEYVNGDKEWWINGKRHREDGPAIEWPDGSKKWYLDGKHHREGGRNYLNFLSESMIKIKESCSH